MTAFEKDVIDRLGRIEERLTNDFRLIHGNGKPGIVDKVQNITTRIEHLEAREKERSRHTGLLAGVIGFIVNAIIALYAALKHQ